MKLLKELRDSIFPESNIEIQYRFASRIIMFDESKLIPILFVSKHNYHKIPWWWIDKDEDKITAVKREALEETWCDIEIKWEIWEIIEYRSATNFNWKWNLEQTSYCYWWKIISKWEAFFTEEELENWFKIVWLPLDEAIKKLKNDKPDNQEWKFIIERDLTFLEEFKNQKIKL